MKKNKKNSSSKKKNNTPLNSYLKKYNFGTGAAGGDMGGQVFDMASDALMGMTTSAVTSLFDTAMGKSTHPKVFDFSSNQNPIMKNGGMTKGTPNAEVEGEEVAETPNGEIVEFEGDSHENGGIEVNLPPQTKIFSKRLGAAGKSMAARKLKREKSISQLEKALEERPHDRILKQTYARTREKNQIEEQGDMMIQESMNVMENATGVANYMKAYGGIMKGNGLPKYANGGGPGFPIIGGMNMANLIQQMQDQNQDYVPQEFGYEEIAKMPRFGGDVKRVQQSIADYQKSFKDASMAQTGIPDFGIGEEYDFGGVDGVIGPKTKGFFDDEERRSGFMESLGFQDKPEGAKGEGFYSPRNADRYVSSTEDVDPGSMDTSGAQQGLNVAESNSYPGTKEIEDLLNLAGEPLDDALFDQTLHKLKDQKPWDDSADGLNIMNTLMGAEQLPIPADEDMTTADVDPTEEAGTNTSNSAGGDLNFTQGDMLGKLGTKISGVAPMMTTLANRLGDTPNINAFLNYGKEGINTLEGTKGMLGQQRDETLRDIKLKSDTGRKRARSGARSINTLRGLEQMANAQEQETTSDIYSNYSNQMMGVLGQLSQAKTQRDGVVMQGEQSKDLADRQDRDNFFTEINKDMVNYGTSKQKEGKDLNQKQSDADFQQMLPMLSQYGFSIQRGKDGQMQLVDSKGNTANSKKKTTKKKTAAKKASTKTKSNKLSTTSSKKKLTLKSSGLANFLNQGK